MIVLRRNVLRGNAVVLEDLGTVSVAAGVEPGKVLEALELRQFVVAEEPEEEVSDEPGLARVGARRPRK